jgi:hypothetical protein
MKTLLTVIFLLALAIPAMADEELPMCVYPGPEIWELKNDALNIDIHCLYSKYEDSSIFTCKILGTPMDLTDEFQADIKRVIYDHWPTQQDSSWGDHWRWHRWGQ